MQTRFRCDNRIYAVIHLIAIFMMLSTRKLLEKKSCLGKESYDVSSGHRQTNMDQPSPET